MTLVVRTNFGDDSIALIEYCNQKAQSGEISEQVYVIYIDTGWAAQRWLEPIADHLLDAGLGQVSEIFDGDPPHRPGGCPAQAWSVACTLEAWWRLARAPAAGFEHN